MVYFVCQSVLQIKDADANIIQAINVETGYATLAMAWREGECRKRNGHEDITIKSVREKQAERMPT